MNRGFLFDVTDSIENNANVHGALVSQVEQVTGRNLVCYFANPAHPGGAMQDHDPDILENVLRSIDLNQHGRRLDLLINSPGGVPYSAAKIVHVCKTFSVHFRALVLGRAMSAATLLCFGAHELAMSATASLGPIDPQMVRGDRLVPAYVIIESFRQMLAATQQAIANNQPADPFLHVLDSLDVTTVFESDQANQATIAVAKSLLREGLLHDNQGTIEDVATKFMSQGQQELHSKHIFPASVEEMGLPVTTIPVDSDPDKLLRDLFVRMELYINIKRLAKYFVTRQGGIDVNIQLQQLP